MLDGLTSSERARFFDVMYGLPEEALAGQSLVGDATHEHNTDTFVIGGCRGEADAAIPGIWELKRSLGPELLELRGHVREQAEFKADQEVYADCMTEHGMADVAGPADFEAAIEAGADIHEATAAAMACEELWDTAADKAELRAGEILRQNHADAIGEQEEQYGGILDQIRNDEEFRRYLGRIVASITQR